MQSTNSKALIGAVIFIVVGIIILTVVERIVIVAVPAVIIVILRGIIEVLHLLPLRMYRLQVVGDFPRECAQVPRRMAALSLDHMRRLRLAGVPLSRADHKEHGEY